MKNLLLITSPYNYNISVLNDLFLKNKNDSKVIDLIGVPIFNHFNYNILSFLKWFFFKKKKFNFSYISLYDYDKSNLSNPLKKLIYFEALKSKAEYKIISGHDFFSSSNVTLNYIEKRIIDIVCCRLYSAITKTDRILVFNGRSLFLRLAKIISDDLNKKFEIYELWGNPNGELSYGLIKNPNNYVNWSKEVSSIELNTDITNKVDKYLNYRFKGQDSLLNFWASLDSNKKKDIKFSHVTNFDILFCFSSEDEYFGKHSHRGVLDVPYSQYKLIYDLFITYGDLLMNKKFVFKMHPRIKDSKLKLTKKKI